MKYLFAISVVIASTCASPHGATSYSNIHRIDISHGHGGGHDGGYNGLDGGNHGGHHHYNHHPEYKYEYGVDDHHTGDHKNQWESRHGDQVKGAYSLKEADGTTRVVEYVADGHNGFNAHVKRIGHAVHPQHYGHDQGHNEGGSWGGDGSWSGTGTWGEF